MIFSKSRYILTIFILLICVHTILANSAFDTSFVKIHKGNGWSIALPSEWRNLNSPAYNSKDKKTVIFLNGDGLGGIPIIDGAFSPIQVGLIVEIFNINEDAEIFANTVMAQMKNAENMTILNSVIEQITLTDNGSAYLLTTEFKRADKEGRLSNYLKLFANIKNGEIIVVTGYIVSSEIDNNNIVKDCGIVNYVKSYITSLVVNKKSKVDLAKLDIFFKTYNFDLADALYILWNSINDLAASGENDEYAIDTLENILQVSDKIFSAHNALAWILLTSKQSELCNYNKALEHALIAVTLSKRQDTGSLDTLALAYFKNGDKENAIKVIKEAIAINPNKEYYKNQLEEFQK